MFYKSVRVAIVYVAAYNDNRAIALGGRIKISDLTGLQVSFACVDNDINGFNLTGVF